MAMKQDGISYGLSLLAIALSVYNYTFYTAQPVLLFPAALTFIGLAFQLATKRRSEMAETDIDLESSAKKNGIWVLGGIASLTAIAYISSVSNFLVPATIFGLSIPADAYMTNTIIIAIAEEQFFRGAVVSWFSSRGLPEVFASALGGGFFAVFHLAVYGASGSALVYVLLAGFMLSFIALKTQRLSSSMLVHLANNIVSVIGA